MDCKSIVGKILIAVIALFMFGCEKEEMGELCFIGDSNVARWDLQKCFPVYITNNLGKSNTGIDYVAGFSGRLGGKIGIILTGTNDLSHVNEGYAEKYVDVIDNLGASSVYVFAILPRESKYNQDINEKKGALNAEIREMVEKNGWHYIDLTDQLMDGQNIKWEYYSDGLHLSEHGYELLTNVLKKKL